MNWMKRIGQWLVMASLAMAGVCAAQETVDETTEWNLNDAEKRGVQVEWVSAPDADGLAARFSWTPERFKYMEYNCNVPVALPGLASSLQGTMTFRFRSGTPEHLRTLAVRLIDAEGEVFHATQALTLPRGEWYDALFTLSPERFANHWGGNDDGKMDFPVRFLGFSIDFSNVTGDGEVLFDGMAYGGGSALTEVARPVWAFDLNENWRVHGGQEAGVFTEMTENGWRVSCEAPGKAMHHPVLERGFQHGSFANPERMALDVELVDGGGVALALRMIDAQGEVFQFAPVNLASGENRLEWDLSIPEQSWGGSKNGELDAPLRFHELILVRYENSPGATLVFRNGVLTEMLPALACIRPEIVADNAVRALVPGRDESVRIRMENIAKAEQKVRVRLSLEDFYFRTVRHETEMTLAPENAAEWELPLPPGQGIWYATFVFEDPQTGATRTEKRSFCRMTPAKIPAKNRSPFLFGLATHSFNGSDRDHEREVEAAALCGAQVVRTDTTWNAVQSTPGEWKWERLDKVVDDYGRHGIELQALLTHTPKWALDDPADAEKGWEHYKGAMPKMELWLAYVRNIAARYDKRIRYWEVWNEPDIGFWTGTLEQYMTLLKASYAALKEVNPDNQVMTGGFAGYERNPSFIDTVVTEGKDFYDVIAWHRHGMFGMYEAELKGPIDRLRKKVGKPVYFNETAMYSADGNERMQAETLFKKMVYTIAWGGIGYTWYDLRNDGYSPTYAEHLFGLLTHDFYPKAAYPAYTQLVSLLADKPFLRSLSAETGTHIYLFGNGEEQVVASWMEDGGASRKHYFLRCGATEATLVDLMGNRTPVAGKDGYLLLPVDQPGYLLLRGASADTVELQPLITVDGGAQVVPGDPLELAVAVANPLKGTVNVALTCELQGFGKMEPVRANTGVASGKTESVGLTLPTAAQQNAQPSAILSYTIPEAGWTGRMSFPVRCATRIVAAGGASRTADFILSDRKQQRNLFDYDPMKAHLNWAGAADLSAKAWIDREADGLLLRVEVTDDRHAQAESGFDIWKGDSLQFGLRLPGQNSYWEIGAARGDDGKPVSHVWIHPDGVAVKDGMFPVETEAGAGGNVTYRIRLPYAALGIPGAVRTFGFDLVVNDNDGEGRESYMALAGGIAHIKDPALFRAVVFGE